MNGSYCDHGINHSGERHGCDGCCKRLSDAHYKVALAIDLEREAEWKRANHWMAVALAFRDATTEAAVEARDGERDPYLERAQNLFNVTARDFGPVPERNRFHCDCCDGVVRIDEGGLCAACGGDTWGVFDPVVRPLHYRNCKDGGFCWCRDK